MFVRAAIYARFSTTKQSHESIETQVDACREYCQKKGYTVVAVYADEGKSGTKIAGREQYIQMLEDAGKVFDTVIFYKLTRNARNELVYYTTKDKLLRAGCRYEYATIAIDSSPAGQFLEGVLASQAAMEARTIAELTRDGMMHRARKAFFNGGVPPLGYNITEKQAYVINDKEAEWVKLIFKMYASGSSYNQITDKLNTLGAVSKKGQPIRKTSLHEILRNERYIGTYTYNKTTKGYGGKRNTHGAESPNTIRLINAMPAIISTDTFKAVAAIMAARKRINYRHNDNPVYLLTGYLKCGQCGCSYVGHRITRKLKDGTLSTKYYYECNSRHKNKCTNSQIPMEILDDAILNAMTNYLLEDASEENIMKLLADKRRLESENKQALTSILPKLEKDRKSQANKLNHLYDLVEDGKADKFDLDRMKETKQKILELDYQIETEKKAAQTELPKDDILINNLRTYRAILEKEKTREDIQDFFSCFLESVKIEKDGISISIKLKEKPPITVNMVPGTGLEPVRRFLPEGF